MAYLLFELPIVGLLAIFGIALCVPGGLDGQRDGFFLCRRKCLNLLLAADPTNGQNAQYLFGSRPSMRQRSIFVLLKGGASMPVIGVSSLST